MLDAFGAAIAAGPVLLLAIYTAEVVAGLPALRKVTKTNGETPRTVVLMPAHNEASGIATSVRSLVVQAGPGVSVLVVADNCTDDTAALARTAGATVVERHDDMRRGKGYALACGRDALAGSPPDCVVVLDADCAMTGPHIAALAQAAVGSGRAVQSRNLQRPAPTASPKVQISGFAFLVKNLVRQRGMARLGGVATLTGTGMAWPWTAFGSAPLASADLAEDLALGVWLTRQGSPPAYADDAETWSEPAAGADLMGQRRRWEQGFLTTARHQALPLIASGLAKWSRSRLWLGLHLLVPPLALLLTVAAVMLGVTLIPAILGASLLPALAVAGALAAAVAATALAWAREGRGQVSGRALLQAPLYVLAKLPLYRAMTTGKTSGWVRTRRPGEEDRAA